MYEKSEHTVYAITDSHSLDASPISCLCSGPNLRPTPACQSIRLDMSGTSFMSITQLVATTQFLSTMQGLGSRIDIQPNRRGVGGYASRMNLYSLLNLRNVEQFNRHAPGANFIPMERLLGYQPLHGDEVRAGRVRGGAGALRAVPRADVGALPRAAAARGGVARGRRRRPRLSML